MIRIDDAGIGCILGKPVVCIMNDNATVIATIFFNTKEEILNEVVDFAKKNISKGEDIMICRGKILNGIAEALKKDWNISRGVIDGEFQENAEQTFINSLYDIGISKDIKLNGKDYEQFEKDLVNEIFINPALIKHVRSNYFSKDHFITIFHKIRRLHNEFPNLCNRIINKIDTGFENNENMDLKNKVLITTITEAFKKQEGNDGFYDGTWIVTNLNYREKEVELSNGRISIWRKFDEVNEIIIKE